MPDWKEAVMDYVLGPVIFLFVGNVFYITIIGLLYLIWKELRLLNRR